jgi:hypothetical protein
MTASAGFIAGSDDFDIIQALRRFAFGSELRIEDDPGSIGG